MPISSKTDQNIQTQFHQRHEMKVPSQRRWSQSWARRTFTAYRMQPIREI